MQRNLRMAKELQLLEQSPPTGISCWPLDDSLVDLEGSILGPENTPYFGGVFKFRVRIPERYPFEPPLVTFVTKIYHPNIDLAGRICLDVLKMPSKGSWKPSLNIGTVLTCLRLLMSEPNPDDPLMAEIANEFRYNRPLFHDKARELTQKHAMVPEDCNKHQDCKRKTDSQSSNDAPPNKKSKAETQ